MAMRRVSVFLVGLLLVVATAGVHVPAGAHAAQRTQRWAVCGSWREVPVPGDELYPGGGGYVTDVEVVSPSEAWAISVEGYEYLQTSHVYHWGGRRWAEVPFPTPDTGEIESWELDDIEVVSPTEAWVVGHKETDVTGVGFVNRPIAARWNGSRWRLVPIGLWDVHGWLKGLAAVPGTNDLIAVGTWSAAHRPWPDGDDRRALILRWNGTQWRRLPAPSPGRWSAFADVVVAGRNVWALGSAQHAGSQHVLASRLTSDGWNVRWGPRGSVLSADAVAADAIWAVGQTQMADGHEQAMVAHWNGGAWTRAAWIPGVATLNDVVVAAPGNVWAVGSSYVKAWNSLRGFVVHRASGGWEIDWKGRTPGSMTAIGGTPHDLWSFLSYPPVDMAEIWRFTSYHRC
jgi:hypothetical protein